MDRSTEEPAVRSRFTCASCKRLKKKCDKRQPECSLCQRYGRPCLYRPGNNFPRQRLSSEESTNVARVENHTSYKGSELGDGFPVVYFTDSSLFRHSIGSLAEASVKTSTDLHLPAQDLSNLKQDVEAYLMQIHPWVPFLSKRKILSQVLSPLNSQRPDNILLLTAIKLVVTAPGDDPRSTTYCGIKTALLNAELKGIFTFRILQALVLVALYELGHAIYPSAYLTVGCCTKYGIALGINRTIDHNYSASSNLMESEAERRTWWTIILFDRLMNLGCPERAPVIEEPNGTSILPMDDLLWDTGNIESIQSPTLSSLPTGAIGRFALTVQAAFLLGKVLRNSRVPFDENGMQQEEAIILDKAILALTQVSLEESQQRGMGLCSPTTICHSARLVLITQMISWVTNLPNFCMEMKHLVEMQRNIASDMLELAQTLNRTGLCGREESSPFCHDAMYRAAMIFGQLSQSSTTADAQRALEDIERGLQVNSRRWRAAGFYVQLIQARTITGSF